MLNSLDNEKRIELQKKLKREHAAHFDILQILNKSVTTTEDICVIFLRNNRSVTFTLLNFAASYNYDNSNKILGWMDESGL